MTSRKEQKKDKILKSRQQRCCSPDTFKINVVVGKIQCDGMVGFVSTKNGKDCEIKFVEHKQSKKFDKPSMLKKFPCLGKKLHFLIADGWKGIHIYLNTLILLNRLANIEQIIPREVSQIIKELLFPVTPEITCLYITFETLPTSEKSKHPRSLKCYDYIKTSQ